MKLLFILLALTPVAWTECPSGTVYSAEFNKCYQFATEKAAFFLAEQNCMTIGGHLTAISNGFENSLVSETSHATFGSASDFWIGANILTSTSWSWSDNSNFNYTNWAAGQPNTSATPTTQCGSIQTKTNQWQASDCGSLKPYVCEVPGSPTPTTPKPCPTPAPMVGHCQSGWTHYDKTDKCYKVLLTDNFDNAENTCVASQAHLASVHSEHENAFLCELSSTGLSLPWSGMAWIGLHKVNTKLEWTDGTKVDYLNWAPGQPDGGSTESCVHLVPDRVDEKGKSTSETKWNDIKCKDTLRAFICKKDALH